MNSPVVRSGSVLTASSLIWFIAACAPSYCFAADKADDDIDPSKCEDIRQRLSSADREISLDDIQVSDVPVECLLEPGDLAVPCEESRLDKPDVYTAPRVSEAPGGAVDSYPPGTTRPPPMDTRYIKGGSAAVEGQFPSAVAILTRRFGDSWEWYCGGTLINARWVLTAAHCQVIEGDRAVIGLIDLSVMDDTHAEHFFTVGDVIPHESYDEDTKNNDIAVFELDRAVSDLIGLPTGLIDSDDAYAQPGDTITAFGWGVTDTGLPSPTLQFADIAVVNHQTCTDDFAAEGRTITANMLCAGESSTGICVGDSGGGALAGPGVEKEVAGVASWGLECGEIVPEGVFARVSKLRQWIIDNTNL